MFLAMSWYITSVTAVFSSHLRPIYFRATAGWDQLQVAVLITDDHLQLVAEGPVPWALRVARSWESPWGGGSVDIRMLSEAMGSEERTQRVSGWQYVNAYLVDLVDGFEDVWFSIFSHRNSHHMRAHRPLEIYVGNEQFLGMVVETSWPRSPFLFKSHGSFESYPPSGCSPTRIFTHSHPPHQRASAGDRVHPED